MKEVAISEIVRAAEGYHQAGQNWHYHLLTPTCQFNKAGRFALLLEGTAVQESFIHYSEVAEMEVSKSLATLLHGDEVVSPGQPVEGTKLTPEEQAIISLIEELQTAGIQWHHHVFFPGCVFNKYESQYELVLEDPRNGQHLTSVSDMEPKEALKQIEVHFYNQA